MKLEEPYGVNIALIRLSCDFARATDFQIYCSVLFSNILYVPGFNQGRIIFYLNVISMNYYIKNDILS